MRASTLERFHSSAQSVTSVFNIKFLDGANVTRASVNQTTKEKLEDPWGVKVERVEMFVISSFYVKF